MFIIELTIGSLFSGIGGIELGFEREGFRTIWFVEKDEYAQAVLRKNFPGTDIYRDITTLDFSAVPRPDILTGGFPCQDISNAGKRAGITGSRSSLWKYYLEAIRILRPKFAVIENVSALAGRGLDVVLADLASLGYDAEWYNISASSVGAFHRRERIFIIAYPSSNGLKGTVQVGGGIESSSKEGRLQESERNSLQTGERSLEYPNSNELRCNRGLDGEQENNEGSTDTRSEPEKLCEDVPNTDVAGCKDRGRECGRQQAQVGEGLCSAGGCDFIPNTNYTGFQKERSEQQSARTPRNGTKVSNSHEQGLEGELYQERFPVGQSQRIGYVYGGLGEFRRRQTHWKAEPDFCRVVNGISRGMDSYRWRERIKALGNAVVPQVAQVIARAIKGVLDA